MFSVATSSHVLCVSDLNVEEHREYVKVVCQARSISDNIVSELVSDSWMLITPQPDCTIGGNGTTWHGKLGLGGLIEMYLGIPG